jgi:hypothetical protein
VERPAGLREEHLCLAWERQLLDPARLCTAGGERLQVVYPGRRCGDPGPDFRDAVLALADATLLCGDIEVHLDRDGWAAHHHATNPAYDRVILHLTWADAEAVTTSAGTSVRAATFLSCLAVPLPALISLPLPAGPVGPTCPCALAQDQLPAAGRFLEGLGRERLQARADAMSADAAIVGYDQVIWSALLRGLGYQRNREPFQQLSRVVPWTTAAALGRRPPGRDDLTALLLGAAGFLAPPGPALAPDDEAPRLAWQRRWQALRPLVADRPLQRSDWTIGGVRPDNTPARRIAAAAGLASAYATGLGAALCTLVTADDCRLELAVGEDAYWERHADVGRRVGPRPVSLLGTSRERELLVNAVLPGVLAIGRDRGDSDLVGAVQRRYAQLGAAGSNQITRHMLLTIGAPAPVAATAAAEQGLLHLYHGWCRERRCWECPLPAAFAPATIAPVRVQVTGGEEV